MKATTIQRRIDKLYAQLKAVQNACAHPPAQLTKVHRGSTGNYDPSADSYWTECSCALCLKRWIEEGST